MLQSCASRASRVAGCAGGPVDWAFGVDKFGFPHFVNLSEAVGTWSILWDKAPPKWSNWYSRDEEAAQLSLQAKFVDTVLSSAPNCNRVDRELCTFLLRDLDGQNLSATFPWLCCMLQDAREDNMVELQADVESTVSTLAQRWAGRKGSCSDLLGSGEEFVTAYYEGVAMAILASGIIDDRLLDARSADANQSRAETKCEGACPFFQPLCTTDGRCVRPSCSDAKPLCRKQGNDGAMARLMCSGTCGCSDPLSDLFIVGRDSGCLPTCQSARQRLQAEGTKDRLKSSSFASPAPGTCTNAKPDSKELRALVQFATSRAVVDYFHLDDNGTLRTVWATLGCFALNVYDKRSLCDLDGSLSANGMKSFMPFCPVTCGCTFDRLRSTGCPDPCKGVEMPTWDLWNHTILDEDFNSYANSMSMSDEEQTKYEDGLANRINGTMSILMSSASSMITSYCFYFGEAYCNVTLAERFALGPGHESKSFGFACADLSETELAAANNIIDANPRWGKQRYPRSCKAVDGKICADLLKRDSLVLGDSPKLPPHTLLKFFVASHPCPIACNHCPRDTTGPRHTPPPPPIPTIRGTLTHTRMHLYKRARRLASVCVHVLARGRRARE